eukprot:GHVH01001002.1.p1 GENE.GHVH01001002.1~~GHVH01001002.1.p1  ORF type:complete len:605 (+),score=107.23 GHVH01001002.1:1110-2924(+)
MNTLTIMENIATQFTEAFKSATRSAFPLIDDSIVANFPRVQVTNKKSSGDYQFNGILAVFNRYKNKKDDLDKIFQGATTASELAQMVADKVDSPVMNNIEVSKQGFISASVTSSYMTSQIESLCKRGVVEYKVDDTKRCIVDYSSPNIAKEMHVGHLRSTVIGESITRTLEYIGHTVERHNHVGDWGTQFGMLIQYMSEIHPDFDPTNPSSIQMEDLTTFYKAAKKRFDEDDEFKTQARLKVYALQSEGEPFARAAWKLFCDMSMAEFEKVYKRLEVSPHLLLRGESFYNDMIPGVIDEVRPHLEVVDGATCFFTDGKKKKNEVPLMVIKSDGGYGYDTTDLACAKYRLQTCHGDRLIYITDIGQFPHFTTVFKAVQIVGWLDNGQILEHVGFGLVLGEDGKKFKTRSGDVVKLVDLLDEAVSRSKAEIVKRMEKMSEDERKLIDIDLVSRSVGYGAVKYFDLKQHRTTNYAFSYDNMLDYNGNTAVYLLYAYARVCSIFRKCGVSYDEPIDISDFNLEHPDEINLSKNILRFPEVLEQFNKDLHVHNMCTYLYELSTNLTKFYSECRVKDDPRQKQRLALLYSIRLLMHTLLNLLGLSPVERI